MSGRPRRSGPRRLSRSRRRRGIAISSLRDLEAITSRARRRQDRVVHCHGCFDLLHLGHIRHFQAAKAYGACLVVTVTPDEFVNKGPQRPRFSVQERIEAIEALACVDAVASSEEATAETAIRIIQPDYFVKGPDYSEATLDPRERQALSDVGGQLLITETAKFSSTALLQNRSKIAPEVEAYLATLRYSAKDVREWLDKASRLKVLVIGDAIRDEYHYCDMLGKSGKEPMLAVKFVRSDSFAGGVHAVAQHVNAVAKQVNCLSGPETVKRRYIDLDYDRKMFEVYNMDQQAAAAETPYLLEVLPDLLADADMVVTADYGHGLLTPDVRQVIGSGAKFLAVNVQDNAATRGCNTIGKYPTAKFLSLSERELRLDARDDSSDVRELMTTAADARHATMLITRGKQGCIAYDSEQGMVEAPAFASQAVDRMGAGDAVFGVTACCAAVGMPLDLIGFMASAVGTQAVGIVGNARYIEREPLLASIQELLS